MSVFYDRLLILCAERGVSLSRAAKDIGLSNAAASGWADGSIPRDTTIVKLANYFNVSPGYMRGEEQKENPTSQKTGEVDEVTMELLDIIQNGSDADRQDMLDMLRIFNKRREKR